MESINRSEVFSIMLRELQWSALKNCIQMNAQIKKRCTAGGHRLDVKRRSRFEKIVVSEAEKLDFPETLCSAIFAYWYPQQGELHEKLENYFHSDEYKKYLADNDLSENEYVLPDEKFEELFNVAELQKWRVLLCFSPLRFTNEQAEKITEEAQGNTELIETVDKLKEEVEERDSTIARLSNELDSARERAETLNKEAQQLRQERRDLKKQSEAAEKKFENARRENAKLRDETGKLRQEFEKAKKQTETEWARKSKALNDDLQRQSKEVENWRQKYENLHNENRNLNEKIQKAEKNLAEQRINSDKNRQEIQRVHKFMDMLLERIDWAEVGKQIKLTPQLKLRFNSLIRNLHYDKENKPRINVSLETFWNKLQEQERTLIDNIAKSDTLEVESGNVEDFWNDLEDSFEDVQIALESRTILLPIIHEIFYQTLEEKDLSKDTIPPRMAKSKSS